MSDFAGRIRELMAELNMRGPELADKFGITKQAVSSWTTGKSTPDATVLDELASLFDVSIDYLLGRVDNRKPFRAENSIMGNMLLAEDFLTKLAEAKGKKH